MLQWLGGNDMKRYLFFGLLLAWGLAFAQPVTFPQLGPGLSYRLERDGDHPWAISILIVNRAYTEYRLVSTLAQDTIFGLASVIEQVKGLPAELGTPMAAVNGDWFELPAGPYQGDLDNIFIHRGQLVSLPTGNDAFWIDMQGQPHVDHVTAGLQVVWPDGTSTPLGLNGPRYDNGAVLYTPILGPSTRTAGGRELILEKNGEGPWLPLRIGGQYTARVREVREVGDTPLAPENMVLSLGPQATAPPLAAGDIVQLSVTSTPDLAGVELAMGGSPILLKDGKAPDFGAGEQPRHPRTLIGWNAAQFFFVVVDGRRPDWSAGMSIPELAALAVRLGCTDAINFDGGGSSTLWLNGTVINLPSDGQPRRVGNALVLVKR